MSLSEKPIHAIYARPTSLFFSCTTRWHLFLFLFLTFNWHFFSLACSFIWLPDSAVQVKWCANTERNLYLPKKKKKNPGLEERKEKKRTKKQGGDGRRAYCVCTLMDCKKQKKRNVFHCENHNWEVWISTVWHFSCTALGKEDWW